MESFEGENWKDVNGYEGLYQVSTLGRIKCLNYLHHKGKIFITKGIIQRSGYLHYHLYKDGNKTAFTVHRLIATNFIQNPENKPYINHKNGIKTDNRLENLEWCTPSENAIHALENGLVNPTWRNRFKENHGASKVCVQLTLNGRVVNVFLSQIEAMEKTGIHKNSISKCMNGKRKTAGGYVWKERHKNKIKK